ncbi:MAG: DUF4202 domain-containing protein [Gammaproteobacteria bacterium]|nr:DUF4202 domain-containing protein [Gammaproteobacteria bacterium]
MSRYEQTVELIDNANSQDPNIEQDYDGNDIAKELLYGRRMADMIERFAPDADEVQKLSVRAQHIERWKSPRSDYPMNKKGYHLWRTKLYSFHAETLAALMQQTGYGEEEFNRALMAVGKKKLKTNADTQMLENIAALTFIEHYMLKFAEKHPEYSEEKWIEIILKTWRKMSDDAQQFALGGKIKLPEPLIPLIQKSLGA